MDPAFPDMPDLSQQEGGRAAFDELVETLKMKPYLTSKLTLKQILSISLENVNDQSPKTVEDVPWNFLRKLMALDESARDIKLETNQSAFTNVDEEYNGFSCLKERGVINPLDVLCALLHCSDSFLQQEIISKMAMCHFAVPLLLPAVDGSYCTLMLWTMRNIVKKWRPQSLVDSSGYREENVVNISMPVFSFVRLGKNKLPKSKILNQILNRAPLYNKFFVSEAMHGGSIDRKISDGLLEITWHFPCGTFGVFPEPIAVTNLRGNLETNWNQFTFLTRVSTAVFIFMESISEEEFKLLSSFPTTDTKYCFVITPGLCKRVSTQTRTALVGLSPVLQLENSSIFLYEDALNEAKCLQNLRNHITHLITNGAKHRTLVDLENEADKLQFRVDERVPECQVGRDAARNITAEIKDVAEYKEITMVLQGELWKEITKIDKELCRMTNQGDRDTHEYRDELKKKRSSLLAKQNNHDQPHGIRLFIDALSHLSKTEKQYFLKWLKFELDSIVRKHLSALRLEYNKRWDNNESKKELRQIDQKICNGSLGIEHFICEMGQYYEAECSFIKENKINNRQRKYTQLPIIAANLLLDGFPLQLIDENAANIPLQWIADVLLALDRKTSGGCRMRVITVLGLQSTGKSTLLNTMFSMQFPVASGRCTRGAFMTLLNVKDDFQEELGCQFIMLIDTEGLKAKELASLKGSNEHDNELATLVVGLSDITIVNMAGQTAMEMKDILQIVAHAFLRMEVGKKPNCQFVHHNVSKVCAYYNNMRGRVNMLQHLNEMTEVASEMEKKRENKTFSDVIDYNLEKDNWYIPGLWHGLPPMAPVSAGYTVFVSKLKKHLLDFLITRKSLDKPLTIPEFIEWMKRLCNAIKYEKFLFRFKNSLVADAYVKLCTEFSKWEWNFRKAVYDWQIRTQTKIENCTVLENLRGELRSEVNKELKNLLMSGENTMLELLDNYFANKHETVRLVGQYKQDFIISTIYLGINLKRNAYMEIIEAISLQKGNLYIQMLESDSQ